FVIHFRQQTVVNCTHHHLQRQFSTLTQRPAREKKKSRGSGSLSFPTWVIYLVGISVQEFAPTEPMVPSSSGGPGKLPEVVSRSRVPELLSTKKLSASSE